MSLASINSGIIFPPTFFGNPRITPGSGSGGVNTAVAGTADAAGELIAFVGQVYWENRAASKTMDTTSKVHFRTSGVTFADAATNLRIGLQDVISASGTLMTPDGTFDVYADIAGNSGTITSSDDNIVKTITLATSGTKTVAHGDLIAVVFEMTAKGGSDSFALTGLTAPASGIRPATITYISPTWALSACLPAVILEASDGTLGTLRGSVLFNTQGTRDFQASSTPDEYGLIFQVPFRCKVDALLAAMSSNSANADATIALYSAPLGTPVSMASVTHLGEQGSGGTAETAWMFQLSSEVELEPNTDYCVAVAGTGTANVSLGYVTLGAEGHRDLFGLNNCRRGDRSNGSGAFSETTTDIPLCGVLISALDDGTGMGNASLNIGI